MSWSIDWFTNPMCGLHTFEWGEYKNTIVLANEFITHRLHFQRFTLIPVRGFLTPKLAYISFVFVALLYSYSPILVTLKIVWNHINRLLLAATFSICFQCVSILQHWEMYALLKNLVLPMNYETHIHTNSLSQLFKHVCSKSWQSSCLCYVATHHAHEKYW